MPPLAMVSLVLAIACLLLPRGLPGRWLAPFFLLPVFFGRPPLPEGVWRFTLLDVGEGMAAVVQTRNHVLVYNAGPASGPNFDAGSRVVLPYLGWAGIRQVDTLLLSDDSTEHAGGALALVQGLPVGNVLGSWPPAVAAVSQSHQPCTTGQHWTWDGVSFSVLAPTAEDAKPTCVLRIEGGGHAILLPGRLDHAGEQDLLAQQGLAAPLLVLAHEGSSSASGEDFLSAVAPQLALISAGYRNRYHHPSAKVLDRLKDQHIPWLNTVDTGTLIYEFHPGQPAVPEPLRWRLAAGHYWLRPQPLSEQSPAKP